MVENTLTVILAGGVGSRLSPLTKDRTKPSVPFGGKYRIIDFSLNNCLHSGLRRVLVLTQYRSHSLHKHIRDGWHIFNPELKEYITCVPPQMRTEDNVYVGTADAIYQNMYLLERSGAKRVIVLSGDHIYRMDYAPLLAEHIEHQADMTVACMNVPITDAQQFGLVNLDKQQRIVAFQEKPNTPIPLADEPESALASMGIYVFSIDVLKEALIADHQDENSGHDFGKDIIPRLIDTHRVIAYRFGGS
ncbi:MAG: sugar phosphate nucleotidyltransferase, partial [Gammaproteobacteria bacterium]